MQKQPDNQRPAEDRQLVRQWFRDGAVSPLVIPWDGAGCPAGVLWPNLAANLQQQLRSVVVMLAGAMPISVVKIWLYRMGELKYMRS